MCKNLRLTKNTFEINGLNVMYYIYESDNELEGLDPVILIHGGPGSSHFYMETMKQIACLGRKVIFYDQAGCGESSRPENITQDAPWLLTVDYYTVEVQTLIAHLDLKNYHILGHSWGTIVAMQLAFLNPIGLKGLVLSGAWADCQYYATEQKRLRQSTLPTHFQQTINKIDKDKTYDSKLYKMIDDHLTGFWGTRLYPEPDCSVHSGKVKNQEIYVKMQGPSEFTIGGVLEFYNVTSRLPEIKKKTLVTGGEYDTMVQTTLEAIQRGIPDCQLKIFPRCGHCTMLDEGDEFNLYVHQFLETVDKETYNY